MAVTQAITKVPGQNVDSYVAAGDAAGDVLLTLVEKDCDMYDSFCFLSVVGVVDVQVRLAPGASWSNPVALQDMAGTLIDQAAVTTNLNLYGLVGRFFGLRVRASGAAATVHMTAWASGRKT